jgi:hypothetical protein
MPLCLWQEVTELQLPVTMWSQEETVHCGLSSDDSEADSMHF